MTSVSIPPRPLPQSPECKALAVEGILGDFVVWLQTNDAPDASSDSARHKLLRAFDDDGYQFACNLDRAGLSPNAELVELLDNASLWSAHNTLVREWVRQHDVKVPFAVGDRISTPTYKAATVVSVYIGTAQIVIQPDDDGDRWAGQPEGGWIIDPEGATKILGTLGERVPA